MSDYLVELFCREISLIFDNSGLDLPDPNESRYSLRLEVCLNASIRNYYWDGEMAAQRRVEALLNIFLTLPYVYSKCANCWKPRRSFVALNDKMPCVCVANAAGTLFHCSACNFAYYCSMECQQSHWKAHKYFYTSVHVHFDVWKPWFNVARSFFRQKTANFYRRDHCDTSHAPFSSDAVRSVFNSITSGVEQYNFDCAELNRLFLSSLMHSCDFVHLLAVLSDSSRAKLKRRLLDRHEIGLVSL